MTPEQATEIFRLREAKVAPKQIARKLRLRPAEVNTFIRQNAETTYLKKAQDGTLQPLHECIVNQSAAESLLWGKDPQEDRGARGLAQIIVVRQDHNRYLVGSYLVDYWCLGVKDTIPPGKMGKVEYQRFKEECMLRFDESFVDISLEQAQSIVYGAVDYALSLGFKTKPSADFNTKAQAHLGLRPDTLIPLEFGKDGKPFYISGPYDDSQKILKTLEANVGADNFTFISALEAFDDDIDDIDDIDLLE